MVLKRNPFPEKGEFVMCTVAAVYPSHVYLILDEYRGNPKHATNRDSLNVKEELKYNAMGYMHISEIANHWIKNIRDHVKEGQKIVCQVLNVDPNRGYIDLSKRRVSGFAQKEKVKEFKRAKKVDGLLKLLSDKTGMPLQDVYEKIGFPLEDAYGEIWSAFEDIKEQGIDAIMDLEFVEQVDDAVLSELEEIIQQNIEIPKVKIVGEFELVSYAPNGVEIIRKSIEAGKAVRPPKNETVKLSFQLIAPPRYRVELEAPDYQIAESYLKKVESKIIKTITRYKGEGSFKR
ncbi:MAG: translation initiation factor IF-2 subunit alpha [Promethearchaeota archaeon]